MMSIKEKNMRRYGRRNFPKQAWNKPKPKQSSSGKRELEPGEKCLECFTLLDAEKPLFLVSPYGYACSRTCADCYNKKRRYFLDVVIGSPELTSKWIHGEYFPKKEHQKRQFSRPRKRALGVSNSLDRPSHSPPGFQK
jgi:hypothetical protein